MGLSPGSARRCALLLTWTAVLSGCRQNPPPIPPAPPRIVLNADSPRPTIDVVGLPRDVLQALPASSALDAWRDLLKVSSGTDDRALRGQITIVDEGIRFTPMFPLDRGRPYRVTLTMPGVSPVTASVSFHQPTSSRRPACGSRFPRRPSCRQTCCGCTWCFPRRWRHAI